MNRIKIFNGRLITPYRNRGIGHIVIEGGTIIGLGEGDAEVPDAVGIDAQGDYISPGFIDLHTHGAGGHDFMDRTVESFTGAARMHAAHGTTLLYPTTLTSTDESLFRTFDLYKKAAAVNGHGAAFGGLHLEGPYFARSQRGAQDERYLRDPHPSEYLGILERCPDIARWSFAPELPGAMEFGRELVRRGIVPAIAHTDAVYEEIAEAFENGFRLITHFYSCLTGITRRNARRFAGGIESGYLIDEMDLEIIADGIHVPQPLLKLVYGIKGAEHIALVTDSMRAAGMPEGGTSILGGMDDGQTVLIEGGVAWLPDGTGFGGSTATADRLVRTMVQTAEVPLTDAVRMAASTPARIMGLGKSKGILAAGMDADIVIFDKNVNVSMTMVGGRIVYKL